MNKRVKALLFFLLLSLSSIHFSNFISSNSKDNLTSRSDLPSHSSISESGLSIVQGDDLELDQNYKFNGTLGTSIPYDNITLETKHESSSYIYNKTKYVDGAYQSVFAEGVANGTDPNWDTISEPAGIHIHSLDLYSHHKKVVEIIDRSGATNGYILDSFSSAQASGTVEFYIMMTDESKSLNIYIGNSGTPSVRCRFHSDGKIVNWLGASTFETITYYKPNAWYHFSMYFDCVTDTYIPTINGTTYSAFDFNVVETDLDEFQITSNIGLADYKIYVDAVGYSWNSTYNVGDNTFQNITFGRCFELLGTWAYRFKINEEKTSWRYFNVIERMNNLEIISESDKITRWEFIAQNNTINNLLWHNHTIFEQNYTRIALEQYEGYVESGILLNTKHTDGIYLDLLENDVHKFNFTNLPETDGNYDFRLDYETVGTFFINLQFLNETEEVVESYALIKARDKRTVISLNWKPAYVWITTYTFGGTSFLLDQMTFTVRSNSTHWDLNSLNLNLEENDKLEIKFRTNSTDKINMKLMNGTITRENLEIVPQGNYIFTNQTLTFTISEDMIVDSIIFIHSLYDVGISFTPYYIRIYRYLGNILNEYLDPDGLKNIRIPYALAHDVFVFEKNELVHETSVIIQVGETKTILHEYIKNDYVNINFYDVNNDHLEFNEFKVYANYTLNNVSIMNERLYSSRFLVDEYSYIELDIYDSFEYLICSHDTYEESFLDIELDVYELKILNDASLGIYYRISNQNTTIMKEGNMISQEILEFHLSSSDYLLNYTNEENDEQSLLYFTLSDHEVIILNSTYYDVYFSLFDQGLRRLDDSLFSLYINGSRKDFGFVNLQTNHHQIQVYDALNISVFDQVIYLKNFEEYEIIITVHELIIRHLAQEISVITLSSVPNLLSFSMSPDSERSFVLSSASYLLNWVNGENGDSEIITINLINNEVVNLESSYFDVYFSIFNFDGLGLDKDLVRFYINNERRDFGFNTLTQDTNNLKVLDYFNGTIFNSNINLAGFTEYNIFVEVYTLIINNNYTESIYISITRNNIEIKQIIPAQSAISYRFLPNIEYKIKAYTINGTLLSSKDVELESNNQIVSFGFYSTYIPPSPEPIIASFTSFFWGIIIFLIIIIILIISFIRVRKKYKQVPASERAKAKKRSKSSMDWSLTRLYEDLKTRNK